MKKILVIAFIIVILGSIFTVLCMKATKTKPTTQSVTKAAIFPKITTKVQILLKRLRSKLMLPKL